MFVGMWLSRVVLTLPSTSSLPIMQSTTRNLEHHKSQRALSTFDTHFRCLHSHLPQSLFQPHGRRVQIFSSCPSDNMCTTIPAQLSSSLALQPQVSARSFLGPLCLLPLLRIPTSSLRYRSRRARLCPMPGTRHQSIAGSFEEGSGTFWWFIVSLC
jgi:hypothetical protein